MSSHDEWFATTAPLTVIGRPDIDRRIPMIGKAIRQTI